MIMAAEKLQSAQQAHTRFVDTIIISYAACT